jgi:hypothetical protein
MCPSMIRKLKIIVYFRKVFLVKIQMFLFCNDFRHVFDIANMQKLSYYI